MPITKYVESLITALPGLQERGHNLAHGLHRAVLRGGKPARKLADLLHGTWLGHPLHVVLTDLVIGAWGMGAVFDVAALSSGDRRVQWAGDALAALGTAAAVPTSLAGLADYSAVPKPAAGTATLHAALNDVNIVLYALSLRERRQGRHGRGVALSLGALALSGVSAWLGGHLVYDHKVGVDHGPSFDEDTGWQTVLDEANLPEQELIRATYDGEPILLYRDGDALYALAATCAHAGGPLDEGEIENCAAGRCTVRCPWHDSVFDLRDGAVVHGPSVHRQPAFDVAIRDGQVQLRPCST
jgi:nitrite reductase/ring-hydroxylating ferredoxin subunit/uncharacterized membrane protein